LAGICMSISIAGDISRKGEYVVQYMQSLWQLLRLRWMIPLGQANHERVACFLTTGILPWLHEVVAHPCSTESWSHQNAHCRRPARYDHLPLFTINQEPGDLQ
jgi:hypothetical protein